MKDDVFAGGGVAGRCLNLQVAISWRVMFQRDRDRPVVQFVHGTHTVHRISELIGLHFVQSESMSRRDTRLKSLYSGLGCILYISCVFRC